MSEAFSQEGLIDRATRSILNPVVFASAKNLAQRLRQALEADDPYEVASISLDTRFFSMSAYQPFAIVASFFPSEVWLKILQCNTRTQCAELVGAAQARAASHHGWWATCSEAINNANIDRWNPALYLDETFKMRVGGQAGGVYLLEKMQDNGMVLSGSRALEYFLGDSIDPDAGSDWDFYVPPVGRNILGAMRALAAVGVDFDTVTARIVGKMKARQAEIVVANKDITAVQVEQVYVETLEPCDCPFTQQLFVLLALPSLPTFVPRQGYVRIILTPHGYQVQSVPDERPTREHVAERDGFFSRVGLTNDDYGLGMSVIYGTIRQDHPSLGQPPVRVQLIFDHRVHQYQDGSGAVVHGSSSVFKTILRFHSSHIQCFLTGYSAVHLYPTLLDQRQTVAWDLSDEHEYIQRASAKAVVKYRQRGYTYVPDPLLDVTSFHCVRDRSETLILRFRDSLPTDPRYEALKTPSPREEGEYQALMDLSWSQSSGKLCFEPGMALNRWRRSEDRDRRSTDGGPVTRPRRPFGYLQSRVPAQDSSSEMDTDGSEGEDWPSYRRLKNIGFLLSRYGVAHTEYASQLRLRYDEVSLHDEFFSMIEYQRRDQPYQHITLLPEA